MLKICLLVIITIFCLKFFWKRRHLYYHSSKVPGPIGLPLIGEGYRAIGSPSVLFKRLFDLIDEYPNLCKVWLATDLCYLVSKPEYFEIILNNSGAYHKTDTYKYVAPMTGDGLFTAPVPIWRRHRKAIAPSFNTKVLSKFMETFAKNSKILILQLAELPQNQVVDVFTLITNCTLDMTCETLFDTQIDAQINNCTYGKTFSGWMDIVFLKASKLWYHSNLIFRLTKYYKQELRYIEVTRTLAKMILKTKQEDLEQNEITNNGDEYLEDRRNRAFLEHLLRSTKSNLSPEEIENELITFLIGGTDTTATTICFTMLLLGIHEDIQAKVYNEIIDVLGNDKPLDFASLADLRYTERVIKEALRLFPGGAIIGRKITRDITLDDGIVLPKDSEVILGFLHVHRNAKYWPDPLRCDPDRFLPEEVAKRHPYCWQAFSSGLRNCIGAKFAMLLIKTVLIGIVKRFKIKSDYKNVEEVEIEMGLVIKPKNGYKISLECR